MAWTAPNTYIAGAILTAAQLNAMQANALAGGPIYANEAARDAAIPSPFEGQRAYLTAPTVPATTGTNASLPTGIQTVWNGTVWVCLTSVGVATPGASAAFGTSYANVTVGGVATSVTLVTGTTALVSYSARIVGNGNFATLSVKSATLAASNDWAAMNQAPYYVTVGRTFVMPGLTAGTNTFTLQAQNNLAGGTCDQIELSVQAIA